MPKALTEEFLNRIHHIYHLVVSLGCTTTTAIQDALGLNHTRAYYALQFLRDNEMVVEVVLGKVAIWCADEESARRTVEELKSEVRRLLCNNRGYATRYVTPKKALELVESDKRAREIFSRYVMFNKTKYKSYRPLALAFIDAILRELFGESQFRRSRGGSVYLITC